MSFGSVRIPLVEMSSGSSQSRDMSMSSFVQNKRVYLIIPAKPIPGYVPV